MCGIAGVISHRKDLDEKIVVAMNDLQVHRGPDGSGVWSSKENNVHFGHRRLSIIDLSESGAQPMHSADGRYAITYNGEIYNFQELKEKCIQKGSNFLSKTDTEVIIEYIRHFGVDGIKDLRGMWAFALYDSVKNTVIMSRDPFGIKPLHYGIKDGIMYFASEIKSLRCTLPYFNVVDEVTEKIFINTGALDIGEWTFFKNVKRFPHGHFAEIDLNKELCLKTEAYWQPPQRIQDISEEDALKRLQELLEQSVKRHMIADVDVAFCLSGGLDSSTIVGIANKRSQKGQKLKTFTTHYPDFPEIDETKWAKMAIDHCDTDYEFVKPSIEEFKEEFYKVIYHHDEPFGSTSVYAQNAIFKAINKSKIKVSLDGQGADEIFAGYHSYFPVLLFSLLGQGKIFGFIVEFIFLIIKHPSLGFKLFSLQGLSYLKKRMVLLKAQIGRKSFLKKVAFFAPKNDISSMKSNSIGNSEIDIDREYAERVGYINGLSSIDFYKNLVNSLVATSIPQLLRNGDRNSMKSSIESRVPFLDIDLVDFVVSLPDNFKIRRAITKYILRLVSVNYLPQKLVYRKDKLGFPSPEKLWLKEAFNVDVMGPFSKDFRIFIVNKWKEVINAQEK